MGVLSLPFDDERRGEESPWAVRALNHHSREELMKEGALQSLVRMVVGGTFSARITLWVGGAVVVGRIISAEEYASRLGGLIARELEKSYDIEGAEGWKGLEEGLFFMVSTPDDQGRPSDRDHIHLELAGWWAGETFRYTEGVLWRARLDRVDAYAFGAAVTPEETP